MSKNIQLDEVYDLEFLNEKHILLNLSISVKVIGQLNILCIRVERVKEMKEMIQTQFIYYISEFIGIPIPKKIMWVCSLRDGLIIHAISEHESTLDFTLYF